MEKEYTKDKSTGVFEPRKLINKALAELDKELPEEEQEEVIKKNISKEQDNFGK